MLSKPEKTPHIMFFPLNWGLGHAGRMIPLARVFLDMGCRVTMAADGLPLLMLRDEFGEKVTFIDLPGPRIRYSRKKSQVWAIASRLPSMMLWFFRERRFCSKWLPELEPDIIISDNRYGIRQAGVFSVFVTHQLFIRFPSSLKSLEKLTNRIIHRAIRRFDLCLVPDFAHYPGLSGQLGHTPYQGALLYTGPLSRFSLSGSTPDQKPLDCLPDDFVLVILSGPEPHRTLLEKELKKQLTSICAVWFRGLPGSQEPFFNQNHVIFDHGNSDLIGWCIQHAKLVICRSGYSSVMDLAAFGKKALMIPTPGQPEQEYLARHLQERGYIKSLSQYHLENINKEMAEALQCTGIPQSSSKQQELKQVGEELLKRMRKRRNNGTGN